MTSITPAARVETSITALRRELGSSPYAKHFLLYCMTLLRYLDSFFDIDILNLKMAIFLK